MIMAMTNSSDTSRGFRAPLRRCCKLAVAAVGWLDLALKNHGSRAKACELLVKRLMQDGIGKMNKGHYSRHPEVIERLCADAANLLWPLLDCLIWCSGNVVAAQGV